MNRNYRPIISLSLLVLAAVSGTAAAQAPVYEAGSGSLEDRVTRLERMMEARNQLLTETQQQLMSLQGEMDQLRGSLERSEYQLNQAVERQRQLYQELDNVSAQNKQAADTATTDTTAPAAATAPVKDVVVSDNAVENQAYDAAVQLVLRDKQYDKAITAFQDFIAKYPKSVYRPNAHYWLGQLLFSQKRTDEAAAQFAAVVKDFPKSPKRADAMLKLGVIAQEKGDVAGAKTVFQQIISAYPTSSSAKMAKSRLAALGG
ncbi:MAG: tol-pal system protein YbgF [Plesiomonas shigelloides]